MLDDLWRQFEAYLENEYRREISQAENEETGIVLFLFIVVWLIAFEVAG